MTDPGTHGDRNDPCGAVPILPGWHRVLVVADIHNNIQALDAILTHVRGQGGFTDVWVLGDWGTAPTRTRWSRACATCRRRGYRSMPSGAITTTRSSASGAHRSMGGHTRRWRLTGRRVSSTRPRMRG